MLTEAWFIGDDVSRHKRNVAREAVRAFVYVQEGSESVPGAVLE